jgi:hypothetical protein
MTAPSITYTFSPNTTASSGEVNQNFTDLITYVTAKNNGSSTWDSLNVTTAAAPIINLSGSGDIIRFQSSGTDILKISDLGAFIGNTFFKTGEPWKDVKAWGAAGDGSTDDTTVFNNTFSGGGRVYIPSGTYILKSSISIPSNTHVFLHPNAKIKAYVQVWTDTALFNVNGTSNVTIEGGTFDGNKSGNSNGRIYGISIFGDASNVKILRVRCIDMPGIDAHGTNGGDGIIIGESGYIPDNILIDGVVCDGNVRQGLSVITGTRIRIVNSAFLNTTGDDPGYGIDLEPNVVTDTLNNVLISNCAFYNNHGGGVITNDKCGPNICIHGNIFQGGSHYEAVLECRSSGMSVVGNSINLENAYAITVNGKNITCVGNSIVGDLTNTDQRAGILVYDSTACNISNNTVKETWGNGLYVDAQYFGGSNTQGLVINGNSFYDCQSDTNKEVVYFLDKTAAPAQTIQYVSLVGNVVYDSRGAANAKYGFYGPADAPSQATFKNVGNMAVGVDTEFTNLPAEPT